MKALFIVYVAAVLFGITLLLLPATSAANTVEPLACNVTSATYPTIQSAVDDGSCAEVLVASGTFTETITISRTVTIQGQGENHTIVDGGGTGSVFTIETSAMVTITGVTIQNGTPTEYGSGIFNEGTLTLEDSTITDNVTTGHGGGIYNEGYNAVGNLTLIRSVVSGNASYRGGGINNNVGALVLIESAITGNTSTTDGGGLFSWGGTVTLNNSTISNNVASGSGGIHNRRGSILVLNNSTVSGNIADYRGGIYNENDSTMILNSSTVFNNSASQRFGGIQNHPDGTATIKNSIIAGNSSGVGPDCDGPITSAGYNLIGDTSGCVLSSATHDLTNIDPNLGPMQGSPGYHPLVFPSPAINAGNPAGCTDHLGQVLNADQRGVSRVGRCDIGAYEHQGEVYQINLPACLNNYCSDFFDDFSNPNSGWPVGEHQYYTYGYLSGEYQIRSKRAGYSYLFESPSCRRENYVVEVDARWVGAPGSGHGIIFGIVGDYDRYYLFDVNTDYQMYRLLYSSPSGWETLVSPSTSNAINGGNGTNHLRVITNGSEITLVVNSTTLRVINDHRITGLTGAGIVSESYEGRPSSDARFDNFSMSQLSGNGGTALDSKSADEPNSLRANRNSFIPLHGVPDWESYSEE